MTPLPVDAEERLDAACSRLDGFLERQRLAQIERGLMSIHRRITLQATRGDDRSSYSYKEGYRAGYRGEGASPPRDASGKKDYEEGYAAGAKAAKAYVAGRGDAGGAKTDGRYMVRIEGQKVDTGTYEECYAIYKRARDQGKKASLERIGN